MIRRIQTFLPAPGIPRKLSLQTFLYSIGSGVFLAGSAVFFTRYVGLAATVVALGVSLSAGASMLLAVPLGKAADRFGAKPVWALTAALDAVCYLAYPLVRSTAEFLLVVIVVGISTTAGNNARVAYTYGVLSESERVRILALIRTLLNIGLTLGGLLCGLVLVVVDRSGLVVIPLAAGLVFCVNCLFILRLPPPAVIAAGKDRTGPLRALRNRAFLGLSATMGLLGSHQTLLNVIFPLWALERTEVPKEAIAAFFLLNTAIVVFGQVPLSKRAGWPTGSLRCLVGSGLAIGAACLLAMTAGFVSSAVAAVVVMILAYSALTLGEILHSSSGWEIFGRLSPAGARGEYQAVLQLGGQGARFVVPAAITFAVLSLPGVGWPLIAVGFVGLGLASRLLVLRAPTFRASDEPLHDVTGRNE